MAGTSGYEDEDGGSGAISEINVTPLVDVTLVLLIIFMVTAKMIASRGIVVETPKTQSGSTVDSTLAVVIDKQRVFYVNGKPYEDLGAARQLITDKHRENPEIKAIISADVGVPHGDVMKAIDIVKLGGVTKFALASEPPDEASR